VGFAAQGHEHGFGAFAGQFRPVIVQVLVYRTLVEADLALFPTFVPEFVFQGLPP
jgi:hypothetical protein